MYDPTIFDNLKVVVEGALYDLDRQGEIRIAGRQDLVDLAAMSRCFRLNFKLAEHDINSCEVELTSELQDFAAELAKLRLVEAVAPGCHLLLRFRFANMQPGEHEMQAVERLLNDLWAQSLRIIHTTSSAHVLQTGRFESNPVYSVEMQFLNKLDEDQMEELQAFSTYAAVTFRKLWNLLRVK